MFLNYFEKFLIDLGSLLAIAMPFLVLGIFVAALAERFFSKIDLIKTISKGKSSIFRTAILGAILPGCACATIPMAHALKRKGFHISAVATFIMISPLLGPHTIILTYGFLGIKFTIARILTAFISSILTGFLFYFFIKEYPKQLTNDPVKSCCASSVKPTIISLMVTITKQLTPYFLIGIVIAAVIQTFIPVSFIHQYASSDSVWTYLFVALLGIPLYVCEGEEIPITLGLVSAGLGHGPALAFMLGAVGTCIPTLLMAQTIIGKRNTLLYVGVWFVFVCLSGYIFQLI